MFSPHIVNTFCHVCGGLATEWFLRTAADWTDSGLEGGLRSPDVECGSF